LLAARIQLDAQRAQLSSRVEFLRTLTTSLSAAMVIEVVATPKRVK